MRKFSNLSKIVSLAVILLFTYTSEVFALTPAPAPVLPDDGQGAVVAERRTKRTEPPRMYQVVLLNDDYTPMEFVVMVLQEYFQRDLESATLIMLKIHHEGRGVCGVYSKDVATTRVELVLAAARRGGHPLQCILEAA